MATGSTVGGHERSALVGEGVEDNGVVVTCDSKETNHLDKDTSAGTLVVGGVEHASSVTKHVKSSGRKIAVAILNKGLVTDTEVDTLTRIDIGVEAAIGLICSKVGMV